jgi:iron complex outermembrane receptor protein
MVSVQSTVNLPGGFEFDQFYRYLSALPAQKVEAYQTMDVRLGWRLHKSIELSVVGQNLFQPHHYEWGTGDPGQLPVGIERSAYAKVVWTR